MDIGKEAPLIVIEPAVDPVPAETPAPAPAPEPVREPEPVPSHARRNPVCCTG